MLHVYSIYIHVCRILAHCYAAYIQQCLLSEHKHSKQNDDIHVYTVYSTFRPESCIYIIVLLAMFML